MKQLFLGLYLLSFSLFGITGCNETTSNRQETAASTVDSLPQTEPLADTLLKAPETIEAIQMSYAKTMDDLRKGKLDSSGFDYNCQEERAGRVTYFSVNGQLILIRHVYGEFSHYEAEQHYYIQGDQLYFIVERGTSWAFDSAAGEGATKDHITEHRIYLRENQPFHCLEKKYILRSQATDNPNVDDLPNKTIDCTSATHLLETYRTLRAQQSNPTNGCLETKK